MPDLLLQYYQRELAYLRQLAHEFAEDHPEVAYLVAERDGDPAVERLLQGTALLTSRLRQRVEDGFSELVEPLFATIWPEILRPTPARTLVRFSPAEKFTGAEQRIARHTPLLSRPVDEGPCTFRTCEEVIVPPVEVVAAELRRPSPADLQLHITVALTGGASLHAADLSPLTFHLVPTDSADETPYALYECLAHRARGASVMDVEGNRVLSLPAQAIMPADLVADGSGLPTEGDARLVGIKSLQEYFTFPERLLAIRIDGLKEAPPATAVERFILAIHLGDFDPRGLRPLPQHFVTGCVAAENLSHSERLALRVPSPEATEVSMDLQEGRELYSLDRMGAYDTSSGTWVEFLPLVAADASGAIQRSREARALRERAAQGPWRGEAEASGSTRYFHIAERFDSEVIRRISLAITDAQGTPAPIQHSRAVAWLTCTESGRAMSLGVGDVTQAGPDTPKQLAFANITEVRPALPAHAADERFWSFLDALAVCPSRLLTSAGLRQLVERVQSTASPPPEGMIGEVSYTVESTLKHRMLHLEHQVTVDMNRNAFRNLGDLLLFSRALGQALRDTAAGCAPLTLVVHPKPGDEEFIF